MSDFKSKLPDMKELTSMGKTLYEGVKGSVKEIIRDYKKKREEDNKAAAKTEAKASKAEETSKKSAEPASADDSKK